MCPECGLALSETAILRGTRRRQKSLVVLGLLCLPLALALRFCTQNDIRRWYPLTWLISDAASGDKDAISEIRRRHATLELSPQELSMIAELSLAQANDAESISGTEWIGVLEQLDQYGDLTEDQLGLFSRHLVRLRPHARSIIRRGDPLAIDIVWNATAPEVGSQIVFGLERRLVVVGNQSVDEEREYELIDWAVSPGRSGISTVMCDHTIDLVPGKHVLRFTADVVLFQGSIESRLTELTHRNGSYRFSFDQEIEVLPRNAPNPIRYKPDLSFRERLAELIECRGLNIYFNDCRQPSSAESTAQVDGWLFLGEQRRNKANECLSRSVAFDILLEVEEYSFPLGWCICPSGESLSYYINACLPLPRPVGDGLPTSVADWRQLFQNGNAVIVLRTNRDLAYRRASVTECWEGELRIGPINLVVCDSEHSESP